MLWNGKERRKNYIPFVSDPNRETPTNTPLPFNGDTGSFSNTNGLQELKEERKSTQRIIGCSAVVIVASCLACGGTAYFIYAAQNIH